MTKLPAGAWEEFRYAKPIADGIVEDDSFRRWLISQTRFSSSAGDARSLWKEQLERRAPGTPHWWRHYFVGKKSCACKQCGERETDILAVFENSVGFRFALHVEVKSPRDKLSIDQAKNYKTRSECWSGREKSHKTVLQHDEATTMLVCSSEFARTEMSKISEFDVVLGFDEVTQHLSPYPASEDQAS
jgi:hypothetical protein